MTDLGYTRIPEGFRSDWKQIEQGGYTRCPTRSFDVTEADVDMGVILDFIELVRCLVGKKEKRGLSVVFDYKTRMSKVVVMDDLVRRTSGGNHSPRMHVTARSTSCKHRCFYRFDDFMEIYN